MITIAVDAVGGDHYPQNPVAGAIQAVQENPDITILLIGPEQVCREELSKQGYTGDRVQVFNAPDIITMDDAPAQAVKNKPQASIPVGLTLHARKQCDAFVSAGNTGALLAASAFILGRLQGVLRPTISTVYPTTKGFRLMVDVGANLEVKPEFLVQFAKMGEVYARELWVSKSRESVFLTWEKRKKRVLKSSEKPTSFSRITRDLSVTSKAGIFCSARPMFMFVTDLPATCC